MQFWEVVSPQPRITEIKMLRQARYQRHYLVKMLAKLSVGQLTNTANSEATGTTARGGASFG